MQDDIYFIEKCRQLAEKKINLGESDVWKNQDFEILSDQIQEETDVNLSVATLKRIWGKVKYDSKPNITTLNTLAKFIGYENWRAFTKSQFSPIELNNTNGNGNHAKEYAVDYAEADEQIAVKKPSALLFKRNKLVFIFGIIAIFILTAAFLLFSGKKNNIPAVDPALFSFSSKKVVTEGVPNSVIFDYNAQAASANDTILIQQSWDARLQQRVPYNQKQVTSIYYYPGYFKAKLVVNNQIVKEHDLIINSKGWLPLIERDNDIPVYFKATDAIADGRLGLSVDKIKAANIPMQPDVPFVNYYYVGKFDSLTTDDFVFETELKNDFNEGAGACQQTTVLLLCEGNFISIPLSAKGCISDLKLYFLGNEKDGKKEDLSSFGCDFTDWVKLKCMVKNKKCTVYINDKPVYEAPAPSDVSKICGIVFAFKGTGSVNSVKLTKSDGKAVFKDDFEK